MKDLPYPIPASELWEFCNPNTDSDFHKPFEVPGIGTGISNGHLAMRASAIDWMHTEVVAAECLAAVERTEGLPWDFFNYAERDDLRGGAIDIWNREWKFLDERRPGLRSRGELAAWEPGLEKQFDRVDRPRVAVGRMRTIVGIPEMQLLAKLPRCEVFTGSHSYPRFLFFRYNGGQGVLASVPMADKGLPKDGVQPAYAIWQKNVDTGLEAMGGGLVK